MKKNSLKLIASVTLAVSFAFVTQTTGASASYSTNAYDTKYVEVKSYYKPREYVKGPTYYYSSGGFSGTLSSCSGKLTDSIGTYVKYCGYVTR